MPSRSTPGWLASLIRPLHRDPRLAGVYGRQLAHEGASPPELYFLDFLYGSAPRRQQAASVDRLSMETTLFSNVNAAMPRAIWERFPFVEDIIMSEDQEWSRRVLLEGFSIAYEPTAAVRHSHNYTLAAGLPPLLRFRGVLQPGLHGGPGGIRPRAAGGRDQLCAWRGGLVVADRTAALDSLRGAV